MLTSELIRELLYRRDVALARHRAAVARSLGLTDVEMLALVHLRQRGPLAPSQLADLLDMSSGGATALVQRLERAGHVARKPHPTDKRSTLIGLTEATVERIDKAQEPLTLGLERAIAPLAEAERLLLSRFFTDVATLSEDLDATARREAADSKPKAMSRPVPSLWA
jgi:DNA-binding MarR family transcriptional regulator